MTKLEEIARIIHSPPWDDELWARQIGMHNKARRQQLAAQDRGKSHARAVLEALKRFADQEDGAGGYKDGHAEICAFLDETIEEHDGQASED